jgi:hypothetical protein
LFCVYAAWSVLAHWLVKRPIKWVRHLTGGDQNRRLAKPASLVAFERNVLIAVFVNWAFALAGTWFVAWGRPGAFVWIAGIVSVICFLHLAHVVIGNWTSRAGRYSQ